MTDISAERSLIGALIHRPSLLDEVAAIVRPADCYEVVNEQVFAAIERMTVEGVPIDAVSVATYMSGDQILQRHGGGIYLFDLLANTPVVDHATHYAEIVAEGATKRRAQQAMTRGLQLLDADDIPAAEAIAMAEVELQAAVREQVHVRTVSETVYEYLSDLENPAEAMPTPWASLNHLIGGLVGGRVYIVAARPAIGKTIAAVQMAKHSSRDGYSLVHSLEMSQREINQRLMSDMADVPLHRLMARDLTDDEWLRIRAAAADLANYRMVIDDRTDVMPVDIAASARSLAKRGPLASVVVDYLQLMGGHSNRPRHEEVASMSRQMKLLARSLDVPVILVSQLNRGPTQRPDSLPQMSDLRESGALEQDADVIILLSMKFETDPAGDLVESTEDMLADVAKNRHGESGKFSLRREGAHSRLLNPARRWEVPPERREPMSDS